VPALGRVVVDVQPVEGELLPVRHAILGLLHRAVAHRESSLGRVPAADGELLLVPPLPDRFGVGGVGGAVEGRPVAQRRGPGDPRPAALTDVARDVDRDADARAVTVLGLGPGGGTGGRRRDGDHRQTDGTRGGHQETGEGVEGTHQDLHLWFSEMVILRATRQSGPCLVRTLRIWKNGRTDSAGRPSAFTLSAWFQKQETTSAERPETVTSSTCMTAPPCCRRSLLRNWST